MCNVLSAPLATMPKMTCYVYIATESRMPEYADRHNRITAAVSSSRRPSSLRQVAVVSWDGLTVGALALMSRTRNSLTLKTNFSLTDFVELDPIPLAGLTAKLREPHRARLANVLNQQEGGELPDDTAAELKRIVEGEGEAGPWARLEALAGADPPLWPEDREPVVAYERDAVGLALGVAGFDRDPVMRSWGGDTTSSFLLDLGVYKALENNILMQDARVFGDWQVIAQGLVGATRFEQAGRTLTVLNVNQSKIEKSVGCDLIYYLHDYDAYVVVQYKRLRVAGKDWEYRPDAQLEKELERMRKLNRMVKSAPHPKAHRLGEDFCFLKFCKPEIRDPFSLEMSEGMYLPVSLWDKLVSSGQLAGPRGGTALTYHNVDRYFNNTNFIRLVERAWVGSHGLTSEHITKIIEGALKAGESTILATSSSGPPRRRVRTR
jgi:hypothetical protein